MKFTQTKPDATVPADTAFEAEKPDGASQPSIGSRRAREMTHGKTARTITYALVLLAAFSAASQAYAAPGRVAIKNCGYRQVEVCVYDWDDNYPLLRGSFLADVGGAGQGVCRRSIFNRDAPGCGVDLIFEEMTESSNCEPWNYPPSDKVYSGSYTIWEDLTPWPGGWEVTYYTSGFAADCNRMERFILTGTEVSGCPNPPELTLYGNPDGTGKAYTLQNLAMSDLTRGILTTPLSWNNPNTMNDWVRAIKLDYGVWRICEHVDYGGKCVNIAGENSWFRFDQGQVGYWDQRISSIKPIACQ